MKTPKMKRMYPKIRTRICRLRIINWSTKIQVYFLPIVNFGEDMLRARYISKDSISTVKWGVFSIENFDDKLTKEVMNSYVHEAFVTILGNPNVELGRKENGAPFVKGDNTLHISLSHSKNWIAVIASKRHLVGIDVQEVGSHDLRKGAYYFMNDHELNAEWTLHQMYLIWSLKEALFKLHEGNVERYKEDIEVLEISETNINGSVNGDYPQSFYHEFEPNVNLVYSLLER